MTQQNHKYPEKIEIRDEEPGGYRIDHRQDIINRAENIIELVETQHRRMRALILQAKAGDEAYQELEEAVSIIETVMRKGQQAEKQGK